MGVSGIVSKAYTRTTFSITKSYLFSSVNQLAIEITLENNKIGFLTTRFTVI